MRLSVAIAAICLSAGGLSAAENVHAAVKKHTNIPAQALASALHTLAKARDFQLIYVSEDVSNLRTTGAVGKLTSEEALRKLLSGTGLVFRYLDAKTVTIVPAAGPVSSAAGGSLISPLAAAFASGVDAGTDGQDGGGDQNVQDQDEGISPDEGRNRDALIEEIVVTGSNIRGVQAVGAASMTFTREELDHAGFSTVQELFETLPQNLDEIHIDGTRADGASVVAQQNGALASGISLRGLGPGSTLVLLNGKRRPASVNGRVVDVSAIPLSMIERVEMVTGGRSAVYGSDAVAGVVNMVARRSFDGADTQLYYGEASAGAEQFNFSQVLGGEFDQGGFVVGYDYRKEQELDATAAGVVRGSSPFGITPIPGLFYIRAPSEQHVGLFAGHYALSENAELYADTHFSSDKNEFGQVFDFLGQFDLGGTIVTESNQYSAVGGVRLDVGNDWQFDVSALHGVVDNSATSANLVAAAGTTTSLDDFEPQGESGDEATLTSLSGIADGPLGQLWGETVSGAVGVDFRNESYERARIDFASGTTDHREDIDRDVWSIFGEVHLPLMKVNERRLEVSLAARYDHYSDFGSTLNPQLGIEWEPMDGLTLRGSFSTAFRAPDLFALASANFARVILVDDPLAPGTTAALFTETGGNPDLEPEEADTYTLGIDWEPSDRTKLLLSYFAIEYEGRIDQPSATEHLALQDESLLTGLIDRNPTPDELSAMLNRDATGVTNSSGIPFDQATDDPFAIFSNIVLFDNRQNNIGLEKVDGVDVQASTVLETSSGDWSLGFNGTYYLDFTRNFTATSPPVNQINRPGKPVDLRFRVYIGWSRSAWNVNAFANYTDSYDDTLAATPTKIDSWTTVDLTLRYDASYITDSGILNGLNMTLGIDNVFDEDPPLFSNNILGLGFDGVNSSPLGRYVSLRLAKRW